MVTQASPKVLRCLVRPSREGGEDDHLLARGEHVPDALLHGLVLGLVQGDAHLGELGEEGGVVGPARVRGDEPLREGALRIECRRAVDRHRHPGADLGRQVEHLLLQAAQGHLLHQEVEFVEVGGALRHPSIVVAVGGAVAPGEADEAARRRMTDAAQEVEEVARAVGHRRARQQVDLRGPDHRGAGLVGDAEQLQDVRGALGVVLDEVRLVEDHAGPGHAVQPRGMGAQQVVVHDHPARRAAILRPIGLSADHLDGGIGLHEPDLAPPVQLQGGRAHHEDRALRRGDLHGDDGLARLSEPHVVGEDRAALRDQECDPVRLVRIEQPLRQGGDRVVVREGEGRSGHGSLLFSAVTGAGRGHKQEFKSPGGG